MAQGDNPVVQQLEEQMARIQERLRRPQRSGGGWLKLLGGLHLSLSLRSEHVRTVIRNFFPVFVSRGVVLEGLKRLLRRIRLGLLRDGFRRGKDQSDC